MKKKTEKDFEKFIQATIDKYVPILCLQVYLIRFEKGTKNKKAYMETTPNYPYRNVRIHWDDYVFEEWSKNGNAFVEEIILHELCHIITEPLYAKATSRHVGANELEDEREQLTDTITSIILKQTKHVFTRRRGD